VLALRVRLGLSQDEMARLMYVSSRTLQRLECGESPLSGGDAASHFTISRTSLVLPSFTQALAMICDREIDSFQPLAHRLHTACTPVARRLHTGRAGVAIRQEMGKGEVKN